MKLLSNRTGSYLTGNEIADSVMYYGLVLARHHEVDVVDIPYVTDEGQLARVELVVGWLVPTDSVARDVAGDELLEVDTILGIYSRAHAFRRTRASGFSQREIAELQWPPFADEDF